VGGDTGVILLSVTGDDGASVRGTCTLARDGGADETVAVEGTVPLERHFEGVGLDCRLAADGRIAVEVVKGASRGRSTTGGGEVRVSVG
jgi:hypothetical protein